MKRNGFRTLLMMFAVISMLCICSITASASAAIKKASYERGGKVEVDFTTRVSYKNVKVTVKDQSGKAVRAVITEKDQDDLDFRMKSVSMGKTYTFVITGVKKRNEAKYGAVRGKIMVPVTKGAVPVRKIEYDSKDQEVEFDFAANVGWKSPKVKIFRGNAQYAVRISDRGRRDAEIRVRKLRKGIVYHYTISGIRKAGDRKYTTIRGSFMA